MRKYIPNLWLWVGSFPSPVQNMLLGYGVLIAGCWLPYNYTSILFWVGLYLIVNGLFRIYKFVKVTIKKHPMGPVLWEGWKLSNAMRRDISNELPQTFIEYMDKVEKNLNTEFPPN